MKYKFYIYKQNKPVITFNKYDLDDYVLIREVTNNSQWGLKIERDKEFYTVIRREFNGQITLSGEDYNTLISFERDTEQYAVVITRECSGIWREFWKGYFSYFDYKVDMDRCYLTFEPEVWDEYSPVYDQMPIERNVLTADVGSSVFMDSFKYPVESMTVTYSGYGIPANAIYSEWTGGGKYYLYSQSITSEEIPDLGPYYSEIKVYKREIAYAVDDVTPPPGFAANGIPVEQIEPNLWKWARPIGDMNFTTYIFTISGNWAIYTLDMPFLNINIELTGCITLTSILEYFNTFTNLTYVSDFFTDSPCPMGGTSLSLTMVQQISNVRDTADPATRGMMKLKDLLTWIRDTFNAFWYIDSNGDFRIEHRKYFEWGLSYTVPAAISIDLGVVYPENLLKLRRYEWSKPSLFRFEKLEIPYSYFDDWTEASIEYDQMSIYGNETKTTVIGWGTDIIAMKESGDELSKQGWTLLNVNLVGSGGIFIRKVINTVGALTGASWQNARFSPANLFRDLWTWGRLLPEGKVNGIDTTFDSIDRLKKQVEISFPQCCQDIDYNGIFRTPLGDGMLDSAEYESKSGNLKVQLIYE